MKDYYKLLNLTRSASEQEIKKAYREQAMKWHPDRNKESNAHERFIQISEAFEILSNKDKRTEYDRLFFGTGEIVVSTEFSNWQQQAKSKAEEYASMDFEKFQKRILEELKIVAKHSGGLGCFAVFLILGVICLVALFQSLGDGDGNKAGIVLISVVGYGLLAFWAYKRFVPDYQEDRKKITKN